MINETSASRAASLLGRLAFLDAGTLSARMRIYAGEQPASASEAPGSEILCEITLSKPAGVVSGASLSLTQAEEGLIVRTGVASWVRVINGDSQTAFDMTASIQSGNGEAKFTTVQLYAGGGLRLLSAVLG